MANHPSDETDGVEDFTHGAQAGIRKIEATTMVWTRKRLIIAYILMWMVSFVDALQQGVSGALVPYVTSAFQKHSLTAYTGVMSGIIGGLLKLPLAKFLDVVGRPHGFALSVVFLIIGLILMASCDTVQVYAAAQIFYWVGYNSMSYTIQIVISDTSSLQNRGFMFAYATSPYIITTWIAGPLATAFYHGPGWRWAFGIFSIITLVAAAPVFWILMSSYRRAVKLGIIVPVKSERTFAQSVAYYFIQFDTIGLLLVMGGLVFILLPFNLYSFIPGQWTSALVISFLVVGFLMMVGFVIYEKYFAPVSFMPWEILANRTVLGANVLAGVLFTSFNLWNAYFSSFLQVVNGLSLTKATYVTSTYTVGSCIFSLVVGIAIRKTGRFKWIALYFGVPSTILGTGLMVHFRQPDQDVGYVIMCQIFIAFAGGACVIAEQIAMMSAADRRFVTVVLALEGMFTSVFGGVGSSIASAIWIGVFPNRLAKYLPLESQKNATAIFASLNTQLSYPKGDPTRKAIDNAYGDAQMYMCTASCAVLMIGIFATTMWKDISVMDTKQPKGMVV
ncbi:MFS general substrate transporter [Massarina eburnea CBS 473.64]|uniref:MFS general substrate transporter n=1 Tax=Massarina eburnea CBS 473.64 TaxID=1395130 RepID=A0A6A6S9P4_9PLEO|nr:MFS general substrate transporter [Massarina eburnea CBS 473.64]